MEGFLDHLQNKSENTKAETVITFHGYSVKKESLTFERLHRLRKDLTVRPKAHPNYPNPPSFIVYDEGKNWIRIPREYGIEHFGAPKKNFLKSHPIDLKF